MATVVALRHVGFEDAGTLGGLLARRGATLEYVDVGVDDLLAVSPAAPDLLLVLGGPVGVYDTDRYPCLVDELRLIEERLAAGRPLLGICLGAQLIARAAGARVYPGPVKEIGYGRIELTAAGLASPLAHLSACGNQVLHWHGDTFDLPANAERLASTEITENQGFSLGAHVLALQFHLEAEPARFEQWLIGHAAELAASGLDPRDLRTQAGRHGAAVAAAGQAAFAAWLDEALPTAPGG